MTEKKITDLSILIIDNDPNIIQSIKKHLKHANLNNIIGSVSAPLALEKLSSDIEIDVVISDLNMPDIDGIQLIRHLSIINRNISLILISAVSEHVLQAAENIAIERKINILGTLQKPIQHSTLISLLKRNKSIIKNKKPSFEPISLEIELRKALQNKSLSVHYQPQINTNNNEVIGIEALARWKHSEMGMIPPSIFIPLAERLNLISTITQQVNNKVFDEFPSLIQDTPSLTVSINFSHICLTDLNLPDRLEDKLKQTNLVAEHLIIEVTESLLTQDLITTLDILTRLRLKGFGLSIDDFGTGFSTLEQINNIPFTELKIDRAFVHGAKQNKVKKAILESSIALAKKLEMRTVAEGVEDSNDLEVVQRLGCNLSQGYYFAKPMPLEELRSWIALRKKDFFMPKAM